MVCSGRADSLLFMMLAWEFAPRRRRQVPDGLAFFENRGLSCFRRRSQRGILLG